MGIHFTDLPDPTDGKPGEINDPLDELDAIISRIEIPVALFTQEDGTALTKWAEGDTPGYKQLSDKEVVLAWDGNGANKGIAVDIPYCKPATGGGCNVEVHFLARMNGTTNTPTLAFEAYFGAGDTDCAGTDPQISGTTLTEYTMTIASANVPTSKSSLTLVITPPASMTTDELYIYAMWLEIVET